MLFSGNVINENYKKRNETDLNAYEKGLTQGLGMSGVNFTWEKKFMTKDEFDGMIKSFKDKLYVELRKCQGGQLSDEALQEMRILADREADRWKYSSPLDKEDVRSEALLAMTKHWWRFNPDKGHSAVAFFTQIARSATAKCYGLVRQKTITLDQVEEPKM